MTTAIDYLYTREYVTRNKPVLVPLDALLRSIVASCDADDLTTPEAWIDLICWKAGDEGFGHLVDSIMENGFMEKAPIGIYSITDDPYFGDGFYISEGHHRLVAALLLCLDEVWVSPYGTTGDVKGVPPVNAHGWDGWTDSGISLF